jgi:RNase P subunit RPR2
MNLRNFVDGLTIEERTELLDILTENSTSWTTMPPHLKEMMQGDQEEIKVNSDFKVIKQNNISKKRKEAVRANKNTWKDTGEDRHIETPDASITPRNRSKPKKITVTCHKCGQKSKINAGLVYGEFYRCDKCIG